MHMKYREEADYRQAMDELCFSQVAKARMSRNLRKAWRAGGARPGPPDPLEPRIAAVAVAAALCWRWGRGHRGAENRSPGLCRRLRPHGGTPR